MNMEKFTTLSQQAISDHFKFLADHKVSDDDEFNRKLLRIAQSPESIPIQDVLGSLKYAP